MHADSPGRYGALFADVYDDWYGDISDVTATVACLQRLSADQSVLELGVGTGRVAIPLAASGRAVFGIDASPEMLGVLASKSRVPTLAMILGEMSCLPLADSSFGLVFVAFNTLFNLSSAESQRRCFQEVTRVLRPGGRFVVEGFVPPVDGMPLRGVSVRDATEDAVTVTSSRHDPELQLVAGEHVEVTPDEVVRRPWVIRYASPEQIDAMAASAGLGLESRVASWSGEPFDPDSEVHVSVYRRPAPSRRRADP